MNRLPGWRSRLTAYVAATDHVRFAWGHQDCCLWALGAIDAVCGTAHVAAIAGRYDSAEGAVLYAASRGWATAADACRDICGEPYVAPHLMRDGDVATRKLPHFPFGTVLARVGDRLLGAGPNGLEAVPWRVAVIGGWSAFPVGDA